MFLFLFICSPYERRRKELRTSQDINCIRLFVLKEKSLLNGGERASWGPPTRQISSNGSFPSEFVINLLDAKIVIIDNRIQNIIFIDKLQFCLV